MAPTLVEDRADGRSDLSGERERRGMRQRLWGTVSRLAERFRDAVAGAFTTAGGRAHERTQCDGGTRSTRPRDAVAIRPSRQARLESGPADPVPDRSRDHEDEPEVAARMTGERLLVYDTGNADAYVTSDVYERVTR